MADGCSRGACASETDNANPRWRRILWIALIVNAAMFVVEMVAGAAADSRALQADALDFLGDAANYAVSLAVVGAALAWRARAALLKSLFMLGFAAWVFGSAILAFVNGTTPDAMTMGAIGALALSANVSVTVLLYRYRTGDANMRSVWICSRNDAIGNVAVMLAALGVFGTGSAWPDLIVATIMAGLALTGGAQVLRQALGELKVKAA
ncbi:cation transporter [Sphingobium fluviale]|uniref:Cation transporter n=1 Tax=Sphingobium fluviale TaxID=2506423 RepID=A0A4Q1KE76_9SPHN|nr:cation transporter [Sphingobium fluviale]RXR25196.1 cation transporter [Sphingobium fluviale]